MKYVLTAIFCLFFVNMASAQQPINIDKDVKDLKWNRYVTENFTILSIDDEQGQWLSLNLEKIKSWCFLRWGFPDMKFSKECRIVCVPNKVLLKKLFNINESKVEVRKKNNQIEMTVLWLVLDENPSKNIPSYLTTVCIAEMEATNNYNFGFYAQKGFSLLNSPLVDVKEQISFLNDALIKKIPVFSSEKLFTMKEEDYLKQDLESKKVFDAQSMLMCLMMRKEFGEAKLHKMLKVSDKSIEDLMKGTYGFSGYRHFDSSFVRFMKDICNENANNKIPDSYLLIKPK